MTDVSWTINTSEQGDLTADWVETEVPTIIRGDTITVTLGFSPSNRLNLLDLRRYLAVSDAVVTKVGVDGTPYYRELHREERELLVKITPTGTDIPGPWVRGWWGVITGGQDLSSIPGGDHRLELETFVLAFGNEHNDRFGAKAGHEA